MAVGEIHVGDIGTVFRLTLKNEPDSVIDVSSASLLQLKFRKPNGDIVTNLLSLYTNGQDGIVQWVTTTADDLDEDGIWKLQVKLGIGSSIYKSDIVTFVVYPNLD